MKMVSKIFKMVIVLSFMVVFACVSSGKKNTASELNYANLSLVNINKMISSNTAYAQEIDNISVDENEISFDSDKILFQTYNYEFPYPKDYGRDSAYNTKLVKCIRQRGMPCDISGIYNKSRNTIRNYITNLNFLSDEEKNNVSRVIDNTPVYYGSFFEEDEYEEIRIYKNSEIYINSNVQLSKEGMLRAYLQIAVASLRKDNYDVLNEGIWNDILTYIIISSLLSETINNYSQEFYEPVLFVISKVGLENILEAYFRGDYSNIEHSKEIKIINICLGNLNEIRNSTLAIKVSLSLF